MKQVTIKIPRLCLLLIFFLTLTQVIAETQSPIQIRDSSVITLKDVMTGKLGPPTMNVKDIPETLSAVEVRAPQNSAESFFEILSRGVLGGDVANRNLASSLAEYVGAFWTDGTTVNLSGSKYFVGYQVVPNAHLILAEMNPLSSPRSGPLFSSELNLVLVQISQVVEIIPRPDLTKEKWLQLLDSKPKFSSFATEALALSNIKQLTIAALLYSEDNDDILPQASDSTAVLSKLYPYTKSKELSKSLNPAGGQIRYNIHLSGVLDTTVNDPSKTPMFWDSNAWPDGRMLIAFLDGHAQFMSQSKWNSFLPYWNKKYPISHLAKSKKRK